jgi:hypothetical protein
MNVCGYEMWMIESRDGVIVYDCAPVCQTK